MIIYTLKDYLKLSRYFFKEENQRISDNNEKYELIVNNEYHKNDKLFREILNNKKEIIKLLNKYLKPEKELTEEMIEKYDTKFITSRYEERQADIIFKIKDKEIFFLIEHQTKVDKLMAYRILEYSLEIIRTRVGNILGKIEKVGIPTVIPIVIYTGQAMWGAKTKLEEIQVNFEHIKGTSVITGFNLIDIRDEQVAIEEGSAIARMSVIERKKSTKEIMQAIQKMSKYIKEKEERREFAKEIRYLLGNRLTKEEIERIEEILIGKGGEEGMLHAQMVLKRDAEKIRRKSIKEGKEEGLKKGLKEGSIKKAINIAQNMLKENFDIELISKITGLKKEQFMK